MSACCKLVKVPACFLVEFRYRLLTHARYFKIFGLDAMTVKTRAFFLAVPMIVINTVSAQCSDLDSFTQITHSGGSVVYPGTNGSANVNVTVVGSGDASVISFCEISNGFRAGESDNEGSYKFSFSPAVSGIKINLNALSNIPNSYKERVRIKINNVLYQLSAGNIICSGNCFGCSGTPISVQNGLIVADTSSAGNGAGQILIQGVGAVTSIEYINAIQSGIPQGSVFEIFFNNSTCLLPVSLISFAAAKTIDNVQLNWRAGIESRLSHYEIERSFDGLTFSAAAKLPAKGNDKTYIYVDAHPNTGDNYYRLKIVDRDGRFTYSKIVSVAFAITPAAEIRTNPVKDMLTIGGIRGRTTIAVYNMQGLEITRITTGNSIANLDAVSWAKGVYIVNISSIDHVSTRKIIKE